MLVVKSNPELLLLFAVCVFVSQDQLEHTRRENSGLHEGERQLQLKIKTLQNCLKSEKEEVREPQSVHTLMLRHA